MMPNVRVVRTALQLDIKRQTVDLFVIFRVLILPLLIAMMAIYVLKERDAFLRICVVVV